MWEWSSEIKPKGECRQDGAEVQVCFSLFSLLSLFFLCGIEGPEMLDILVIMLLGDTLTCDYLT